MAIVLFRVDERLIHGQVVIGWGNQLRCTRYVVIDDALAESDWEQDLYRLAVPGHAEAEFLTAESAADRLASLRSDGGATVVLFRTLQDAVTLAAEGALEGEELNIGGLRHKSGGRAVRPYLHLDDADREAILALAEHGVIVAGQDLPGSPRVNLKELVRE